MVDYFIFGFGLFVTVVVGFGLTTMITLHNRVLERDHDDGAPEPGNVPAPAKVTASVDASRFGKSR